MNFLQMFCCVNSCLPAESSSDRCDEHWQQKQIGGLRSLVGFGRIFQPLCDGLVVLRRDVHLCEHCILLECNVCEAFSVACVNMRDCIFCQIIMEHPSA